MESVSIGVAVNGDRTNSQPLRRSDDPACDFASVRYQNFLDGRLVWWRWRREMFDVYEVDRVVEREEFAVVVVVVATEGDGRHC